MTVTLRTRVLTADGFSFFADKEVELPLPPFEGMVLYNVFNRGPGIDDSEDKVERVWYDMKTGEITAFLGLDDFSDISDDPDNDPWGKKDYLVGREGLYYHGWRLSNVEGPATTP